jgi:hypothetical protein
LPEAQVGVFFQTQGEPPRAAVAAAIKDALETDPANVPDPAGAAQDKAAEIAPAGYESFNTGRFIGALIIFAAVVGCAIGTDAAGLGDSSKALYGFAATIFGVVVGFLGGEKSATS